MSAPEIKTVRHYATEWTATEAEWDLGMPTGYGNTEQEAIDDLMEQIAERDARS